MRARPAPPTDSPVSFLSPSCPGKPPARPTGAPGAPRPKVNIPIHPSGKKATFGNSTMAVDLSPPLLTGALVVFQMFFRSRDLSGLNIRAPSKPLWCDRAERLRTDRPRIIPPHDTGAQHAGGRRHAPRAGRPHLTPPPSISYLAPRTGSNLGTPRGAPAHSCTSQRASTVEREVHRRTGKCRHPSCATLAGDTTVNDCSALV